METGLKPLKVFLDTEFTDFSEPELISLGLVAASGEECYVEVEFPRSKCSEFVRDVVIPLLGQEPNAFCTIDELRCRLINWFEIVRLGRLQVVEVCFDYSADWDLFSKALDNRVPPWIKPRNIAAQVNELMLYDFWMRSEKSQSSDSEHHALSDARALAWAYRESPEDLMSDRHRNVNE